MSEGLQPSDSPPQSHVDEPTAKRTSLSKTADEKGLSVADAVALGELEIRKQFAESIVSLFTYANAFVFIFVGVLAIADMNALHSKVASPADRIVGREVVMSLIAATTIQLGAVVVVIANYLFPKKR